MSGKLVITHGLPASGKSTWAEEEVKKDPKNVVRVNRDDIRTTLFGEKYHKGDFPKNKESQATQVQQELIKKGLREGKTVISDDTNLNKRFLMPLATMGRDYGAEISQKHFDVPVEECKRRNHVRGMNGGREVPDFIIDRMAEMGYGKDGRIREFKIGLKAVFDRDRAGSEGRKILNAFNAEMAEKFPVKSPLCINFDCDGSLVDTRRISDLYMFGPKRNFDRFHKESEFVAANDDVLQAALQAREEGFTTTVTTARADTYAQPTINWLMNNQVPVSKMWMREEGDFRSDYEVKTEILQEVKQSGLEFVHCFDDNPQAVRAWEENGILVTRVPFHTAADPAMGPEIYTEIIRIESPFNSGFCVRCGQPLKTGSIGPKCKLKV